MLLLAAARGVAVLRDLVVRSSGRTSSGSPPKGAVRVLPASVGGNPTAATAASSAAAVSRGRQLVSGLQGNVVRLAPVTRPAAPARDGGISRRVNPDGPVARLASSVRSSRPVRGTRPVRRAAVVLAARPLRPPRRAVVNLVGGYNLRPVVLHRATGLFHSLG